MAMRGCPPNGRPHRLRGKKVAEQRHRFGGANPQRRRCLRSLEIGEQFGRQPARRSAPRGIAGECLGGAGKALAQLGQRETVAEQAFERFDAWPDPLPLADRFEMRVEAGNAAGRPRSASLRSSARAASSQAEAFLALPADQRMLEQGEQRDRRQLFGGGARDPEEQGAGRRVGQGPACRIVGLDPPACKQRRNSLRKLAVGRDQGSALARRFERVAERKRNSLRFRRGIGQFGEADPAQPPLAGP